MKKNKLHLKLGALSAAIALMSVTSAYAVSVTDSDLFTAAQTVTVNDTFPNGVFAGGNQLMVDGTTDGHVFADNRNGNPQYISVTGFNSAIDRLVLFDTPQFSERVSQSVDIYYSALNQTSLVPGSYTFLGSYVLPTINISGTGGIGNDDQFATPTFGPTDIASALQFGGGQVVNYAELGGLGIPAGTQSILLDMGLNLFGTGLSELQAYAVPEPTSMALLLGAGVVALGLRRNRK